MENTPLLSIGEMITDALRREIAAQIAVAFDRRPSLPLDRRQVAELLKISLPTLKKRTDDGTLNCTRVGRRVLYERAQIDALLQRGTVSRAVVGFYGGGKITDSKKKF